MPPTRNNISKTVLVIDDEEGPRESVRVSVADRYDCHTAASGWEGLEFVRKNIVDVAVVDLKMPSISGIGVLESIRQISPATRVIILTGYETETTYVQSLRLGAYAYLIKPLDVLKLRAVIDGAMTGCDCVAHSVVVDLLDARSSEEQVARELRRTSLPDELQGVLGSYLHDLKSEFLNVGVFVEQVGKMTEDKPEVKKVCGYIQESVGLAQVIVRRLLDYLRLTESHRQSITVSALINRVEALARPRLASTIGFLTTVDDKCVDRLLSIDPEQVVGVLLELVQNAARALPDEGGKIVLGVRMKRWSLVPKPPHVEIFVRDNGAGVPDEIRSRLFKRRLANASGQGLGLFLANKAVRNLDGQVKLESSSKAGSTFTVVLPIMVPPELGRQNANTSSSSRR